ncbi:hypothetical protein [Microbacterium saperdae]|uniref:Uncharacterized protein n=1 Tax=Microbacterium saperdae TaxID=69368 RepID=A0A543BJ86_9MICO|nr:hypothetical protein [Microbacterium saperdae]TQL84899.1 hypothetical protein FB560_0492 [Microbacterium saperdae]GGM58542.1 hypothetical protein GCM10010489_32740 [Microbacterium saperdae]
MRLIEFPGAEPFTADEVAVERHTFALADQMLTGGDVTEAIQQITTETGNPSYAVFIATEAAAEVLVRLMTEAPPAQVLDVMARIAAVALAVRTLAARHCLPPGSPRVQHLT